MGSNRPSILVVDDEESLAKLYATVLSKDYDVGTAHGGKEALEKIDSETEVVLLDRRMPGTNGDEVLAEIREQDIDVRVGMITAVHPDSSIAEMEFDDYLIKPLESTEIQEAVEQLLALPNYDEQAQELFTIEKKKAVIEGGASRQELAGNEEYEHLVTRLEELEDEVSERIDIPEGDRN
ncbi:response regulator [Halorubrum tropicale]|uniref:Response regulatory domain-containing protein n=1 Tax=Halorubrum tropicale TaxID=1765655 RepID=A0A0M9AQH8_9EURY|nr:response regulator [Halorubrum tropicale]KOX95401.1 hypothetical protein AMR74_14680 [Halorubrum tropicale]